MSFEEVCATVGGPPGCYSRRPCIGQMGNDPRERWDADDGRLMVTFDGAGRAAKVETVAVSPDPSPLPQRLRARLRL